MSRELKKWNCAVLFSEQDKSPFTATVEEVSLEGAMWLFREMHMHDTIGATSISIELESP